MEQVDNGKYSSEGSHTIENKDNTRAMTGNKHNVDNNHVFDGNRRGMDGNRQVMGSRHVIDGNRLGTATIHKDEMESNKHGTNGVHISPGVYDDKNI